MLVVQGQRPCGGSHSRLRLPGHKHRFPWAVGTVLGAAVIPEGDGEGRPPRKAP